MSRPESDGESLRLADHLREYLRDPTLWPVLIVAVAIFVTLGTAALLTALRDRNLFASLALLVLAGVSADAATREIRGRGFGPISGALLVLWGLSAGAAGAVIALGWY